MSTRRVKPSAAAEKIKAASARSSAAIAKRERDAAAKAVREAEQYSLFDVGAES